MADRAVLVSGANRGIGRHLAIGLAEAGTSSMPLHEGRTEWTDPKDVVALAAAIADGSPDELSGRFFRADTDTPESLRASATDILNRNARTLAMTI